MKRHPAREWLLPIAFVALAACAKSPSGDDTAAAESDDDGKTMTGCAKRGL